MKKHTLILFLLAAVMLWVGCGAEKQMEETDYVLYFLASDEEDHGPALVAQPWSPEEEAEIGPEELLQALLAGPSQEGLTSTFPRGVTLRSLEWDEESPGKLRVQVSEQYSGLTDISLTLADYAIVLTLAQLEEVEAVEIFSTGYSANYRSHQMLLPEEAILTDSLAR